MYILNFLRILFLYVKKGFAAIHLAAMEGHEQAVECLIVKGADINIKDRKSGRTAYFHAVEGHRVAAAVMLRICEANITEPNFAGQQPPPFRLLKTPSSTSGVSNCPKPHFSLTTNSRNQTVCGTTQFKGPSDNQGQFVSQMNISDGGHNLQESIIQKEKEMSKHLDRRDSLTKTSLINCKTNLVKTCDSFNMSCTKQDSSSKSSHVNELASEINIGNTSVVPPSIIADISPKHVFQNSNIQLNKSNSVSLLKPKFNKNLKNKEESTVPRYTEKANTPLSLLKINNSKIGDSVMTNFQSRDRISQFPSGSVDQKNMLTQNKYFHKPEVSGRDCSKNNTTTMPSTIPVQIQPLEKSQEKDNNSRLGYVEVPTVIKNSHQTFLANNKNHAKYANTNIIGNSGLNGVHGKPNIRNTIICKNPSKSVLQCLDSRATHEVSTKIVPLKNALENKEKQLNNIQFNTNSSVKNASKPIQQRLSDTRISHSENSSTIVSDVQPNGSYDENVSRKRISKQTKSIEQLSLNKAPESQHPSDGTLPQKEDVNLEIEHDEIDSSKSLEYPNRIETSAAIVLGDDNLIVNKTKSTIRQTCSDINDTSLKVIACDNNISDCTRVQVTFNTYLDKFLENQEKNKLESMIDNSANSKSFLPKKGKGSNKSTVKRKCSEIVPLSEESQSKSPRKTRNNLKQTMTENQIKSKAKNNNSNNVIIPENSQIMDKCQSKRRKTLPDHFKISTEDTPTNKLVKNGKKRTRKNQTPNNSDISQANEVKCKRRSCEYERKSVCIIPNKKSKIEKTNVSSSPVKRSERIRKARTILNL